jgi:hypothetical protein
MVQHLKLSEKLFCLSINPSGGIFMSSFGNLSLTLTAAVFDELLKKELISITNGKVHPIDSSARNDAVHEFYLHAIRSKPHERKLQNWMIWFNRRARKIRMIFAKELASKNILRIDKKRFFFISYDKIYLSDLELVEKIMKEVEEAIFSTTFSNDNSVLLAILCNFTNLIKRIVHDKVKQKHAKNILKKLPENDVVKALNEALDFMYASAFATTIA